MLNAIKAPIITDSIEKSSARSSQSKSGGELHSQN
jgi:hypothetical protein